MNDKPDYLLFTNREWRHLSSVMQLHAMTGDKQSEKLAIKIKSIMETMPCQAPCDPCVCDDCPVKDK